MMEIRGKVGKKTPKKEMDNSHSYDVTRLTLFPATNAPFIFEIISKFISSGIIILNNFCNFVYGFI